QAPGILEPPRAQGEQLRLLDLDGHVDELLLRELETGDRLTELHARRRVLQGGLVAVTRGAHDAPSDAVPGLVEARERRPQTSGLRKARALGQADVAERDVALDRRAHRQLGGDRRR